MGGHGQIHQEKEVVAEASSYKLGSNLYIPY